MHSPSVDIKRLARMAAKVAPVTTDADMYDHLVSLLSSDCGLRVDNDTDAPLPWAVFGTARARYRSMNATETQIAYAIANGCCGCSRKDVPLYAYREHAECDDCSDLGKEGAAALVIPEVEPEQERNDEYDGDDWQMREAGMR